MSIIPKKFKFKKYPKGKIKNIEKKKKINFGCIGLKANESGRLTPKQIESGRRAIRKYIKQLKGIVKVRLTAYLPVSSKPLAVRMGRGKGKVAFSICPVKKGSILYEIMVTDLKKGIISAKKASYKLPIKTIIVLKK
jgi:large subunit ribosomal protein L16